MSSFVIGLVLCSALLHAGWNLLARRQRSEVAFMRRMLIAVAVAGLVPAAVSEMHAQPLPLRAWLCALGSGLCIGVYFYALAHAYAASDFTVVYPVARALPVLLVGLGDVLRGRPLSPAGWLGMVLVVSGCFLAPLRSFRELHLRRYVNRATGWMLVAALGTVGFTLLDKIAAEVVRQGPATAARYGYAIYLVASLAYCGLYRAFRPHAESHPDVGWRAPTLGGVLTLGGYWLVLWAYQLSERAGYILAFRQFSIVLGVAAAFLLYREKGLLPRLTATALLTTGLVVIALRGH